MEVSRRSARADEGSGLENRQGLHGPRGFESHLLRHIFLFASFCGWHIYVCSQPCRVMGMPFSGSHIPLSHLLTSLISSAAAFVRVMLPPDEGFLFPRKEQSFVVILGAPETGFCVFPEDGGGHPRFPRTSVNPESVVLK